MRLSNLEYINTINNSLPFFRGCRDYAQGDVLGSKPWLWTAEEWMVYRLGVTQSELIFGEKKEDEIKVDDPK